LFGLFLVHAFYLLSECACFIDKLAVVFGASLYTMRAHMYMQLCLCMLAYTWAQVTCVHASSLPAWRRIDDKTALLQTEHLISDNT
jgi:hypothetical protein